MKKQRFLPRGLRNTFLVFLVVLFLGGFWLSAYAFLGSRDDIYEEFDNHLYDLASSVDHNIAMEMNRCRLELAATLSAPEVAAALDEYAQTGALTAVETLMTESVRWNNDFYARILFRQGERLMASSNADDTLSYTRLSGTDDALSLYRDDTTGKLYLTIGQSVSADRASFLMLFDAESFYRRIVTSSIYDDYWIVLYEETSGLVLHNDKTVPAAFLCSADMIRARQDGLTVLLSYEQENRAVTVDYDYTHSDGTVERSRMSVIPSGCSDNGVLAVAVSAYNSKLLQPIQARSFFVILSALLIAFSSAGVVFLVVHNGKREREMAEELSSLERENELSGMLLRQREELSHHQKLETIGTLTAGVAHEFNNLLSPIMGDSLLILENTPPENTAVFDNAVDIYDASQRAKKLVSQISMLSRKSAAEQMRQIEPAALIENVMNMAGTTVPNNVTVEKTIQTTARVFGNESQLVHMLLNLVINAIQAMTPQGGMLTLFVWDDSRSVFISIADTGKGIPETLLPMLFEPFFTTKESGKGTGLGLSIAQRTAVNHGGSIAAENLPDGGAMFTVQLPIYLDY